MSKGGHIADYALLLLADLATAREYITAILVRGHDPGSLIGLDQACRPGTAAARLSWRFDDLGSCPPR